MDGVATLQIGLAWAHEILDMVTADMTAEQAEWQPPGNANPAGAQYAHAICAEDFVINTLLRQGAPLFAGEWLDRTGISDPQPMASPEWARSVQVDLDAMRPYANAVGMSTDTYLASLTAEDLVQPIDMSALGFGERSVVWILNAMVIGHMNNMAGEISCLKGLQGGQGYPF